MDTPLNEDGFLTDEQFDKAIDILKKPLKYPTATVQEEKREYPSMGIIMGLTQRASARALETVFTNTHFTESGLARMQSCIGFLMGVWINDKEQAEEFASSLLNAFRLGMSDQREVFIENREGQNPHMCKLVVADDGTFMGFSFLYMRCLEDQTADAHETKGMYIAKYPGLGEYSKEYRYVRNFNGGIIFHGLQQVFSVTMGKASGWSMHT